MRQVCVTVGAGELVVKSSHLENRLPVQAIETDSGVFYKHETLQVPFWFGAYWRLQEREMRAAGFSLDRDAATGESLIRWRSPA